MAESMPYPVRFVKCDRGGWNIYRASAPEVAHVIKKNGVWVAITKSGKRFEGTTRQAAAEAALPIRGGDAR